jgi:hypothetical protein
VVKHEKENYFRIQHTRNNKLIFQLFITHLTVNNFLNQQKSIKFDIGFRMAGLYDITRPYVVFFFILIKKRVPTAQKCAKSV